MVSSLCFTCSDIILLIDIRLSVMLLLVSTKFSLVAFLRQKHTHTQNRAGEVLQMGSDMPNLLLDYIKVIYWRLEGIFFSLSSLEPCVSTTSATSHSIFIFIYLFWFICASF